MSSTNPVPEFQYMLQRLVDRAGRLAPGPVLDCVVVAGEALEKALALLGAPAPPQSPTDPSQPPSPNDPALFLLSLTPTEHTMFHRMPEQMRLPHWTINLEQTLARNGRGTKCWTARFHNMKVIAGGGRDCRDAFSALSESVKFMATDPDARTRIAACRTAKALDQELRLLGWSITDTKGNSFKVQRVTE